MYVQTQSPNKCFHLTSWKLVAASWSWLTTAWQCRQQWQFAMYYKLENRTRQKNWKPLHPTIQACQRAAEQNWNETMKSIWSHRNACCRAAQRIIQQFTFEHDLRAASFQDFMVFCRRSTLSVEQWNHIYYFQEWHICVSSLTSFSLSLHHAFAGEKWTLSDWLFLVWL